MLLCKQADCSWHLVCLDYRQIVAQPPAAFAKVTKMSDTTSAPFAPSSSVFGRLVAAIDRLLMSSARIAVRNGDQPRFGL